MGLFKKVTGAIFGSPDFGATGENAFRLEQERLRKLRKESREEAVFLNTEGEGISESADFSFGDELDLEDLSEEERTQRSTGRITPNTGLIL